VVCLCGPDLLGLNSIISCTHTPDLLGLSSIISCTHISARAGGTSQKMTMTNKRIATSAATFPLHHIPPPPAGVTNWFDLQEHRDENKFCWHNQPNDMCQGPERTLTAHTHEQLGVVLPPDGANGHQPLALITLDDGYVHIRCPLD